MEGIKTIAVLLLILLLQSCSAPELVPSDYVAWVNEEANGLLKKKTIAPLEVELLYKPVSYIIANEKRSNEIAQADYDKRAKELEGMQYFTLKLGIVGGQQDITNYRVEDAAQQQERLNYLSFAMQKDIKLIEGGDTLACQLYHFERSYDIASYRTFVLGFDQKGENKIQDKTLILDLPYFKTGPIKLNYKTSELEAIPTIKL